MPGKIIVGNKEVTLSSFVFDITNFKETGEEFVHYARTNGKPKKIILHWTGGERGIDGVEDTLRKRKLGCHFIVDVDGTIQQYVDPDDMTWHAGGANKDSIGFEIVNKGIASKPLRDGREEYATDLLGKKRKFTTFTREQIDATKFLVRYLCSAYNIPYAVPVNESGELLTERRFTDSELANYSGVCGHYHVDLKKEVKLDPGIDLLNEILQESKTGEATVFESTPSEPAEPSNPEPRQAIEKYEATTQGRTEPPDGKPGYYIVSKEKNVSVNSLDKNASDIIEKINQNNVLDNPFIRFNRQLSSMREVTTLELASVVPVIKIFAFATQDDTNRKSDINKSLVDLNELIFSAPSAGEDILNSKYDYSYSNPERPIASIKDVSISVQPPIIGGTTGISTAKLSVKIHNFDLVNKDHPRGKYLSFLLRQNYHVRLRFGAETAYQDQHLKESFQWIEQDFFTTRHEISVANDLTMDVIIELAAAEQKLFNQILIGESLPAETISESDLIGIEDEQTRKDLNISIKVFNRKVSQVGQNDVKNEDGTISSILHGTITSKDFENQLNSIEPIRKSNLINGLKTIQARLLTKKYKDLLDRYCYQYKGRSSAGNLEYQAVNFGCMFSSLVAPEIRKVAKMVSSSKIKVGNINSSNYGSLSDNRTDVGFIFGNFNAAAAQWSNKPISTFPINAENLFSYLRAERDIGNFSNSIASFMNHLSSFIQDSAHYVVEDNTKKLSKPQLKFSFYPNPYYEKNGLPAWLVYVYDAMSVAVDFSLALENLNNQPLTKDGAKEKLSQLGVPFIEPGTNYSLIKSMTANTMGDDTVSSAIFYQANQQAFNSRQVDASKVPVGISREFLSGIQLGINRGVAEQNIIYPLQVSIDHYFMSSAVLYGHVYLFFPSNLFSGLYIIDGITHEISHDTLITKLSLKMQPTRINVIPQ